MGEVMYQFMEQHEILEPGSIKLLPKIIQQKNFKRLFLVTGQSSFEQLDQQFKISKMLRNWPLVRFSEFETNPKLADIKKGIDIFRQTQAETVIAIGGGSVMDVAKAINFLAVQEVDPEVYLTSNVNPKHRGLPLIAVPTTSGSGSEATRFAVVYIDKVKYSLSHDWILPEYAIIDPELTHNLPPKLTAVTGFDALSQAIEAYWSVNSTSESKKYSREAIKLILQHLEETVNRPRHSDRTAMSKAAHLASKAINIALTTACHAISYPITSYFGIPHGHAVALTLGRMLVYNSRVTKDDINDARGVAYVKNVISDLVKQLGSKSPPGAARKISALMESCGLECSLSELKIDNQGIETVVKNGFNPGRMKNNPRMVTETALRKIL